MRGLSRFIREASGASAVEFALVLPIFATFLFGTIQTGMALYKANTVQFALEQTARRVMVNQAMTQSQVQAYFNGELDDIISENVTVSYAVNSTGDVPIASFAASYTHEFVIPFVPTFEVTFDAAAEVPLEPD